MQEALAKAMQGWIAAQQGELERGLAAIGEAMRAFATSDQQIGFAFVLGLQADVYAAADRFSDALHALDECDSHSAEEQLRANTLRRRAEVLARSGADAERVDETYRDALACARTQGTRGFELRAALSYARWLDEHGRRPAARTVLIPFAQLINEPESRDVLELQELLQTLSDTGSAPGLAARADAEHAD
jgi:hypothetical protein